MSKIIKISLLHLLAGIPLSLFVLFLAIGNGYEVFSISIPIANFIVTFFSWKVIVNNREPNFIRLFYVSLFSGIFNHYVTWIIVGFISYFGFLINKSFKDSLGGAPANPLQMLSGGLAFSFFSLLFFGWLSLLLSFISIFFGNYIFKNQKKINAS